MKEIKIKDDAAEAYKKANNPGFQWKYYHILKKLEGQVIKVEKLEGRWVSPPIHEVSIMPFTVDPDYFDEVKEV